MNVALVVSAALVDARSAAQAFAQPLQLWPDMFAAEFALEFLDRIDAGIGAQARQPRGVAQTCVLRRDRLTLRLLPRRRLGIVVGGRDRRPRPGWGGGVFRTGPGR